MSNFIDFLLVISKLQSPIYRRSPQSERYCSSIGLTAKPSRRNKKSTFSKPNQKKAIDLRASYTEASSVARQ